MYVVATKPSTVFELFDGALNKIVDETPLLVLSVMQTKFCELIVTTDATAPVNPERSETIFAAVRVDPIVNEKTCADPPSIETEN